MVINGDFFDFKRRGQQNHKILNKESMFKIISMFNFVI